MERAASAEPVVIGADLENSVEMPARPQSSLDYESQRVRKKKKKKVKKGSSGRSQDIGAFATQSNKQVNEFDNTTIGGVLEIDDSVYRTDIVTSFLQEDNDEVA